MIVAGCHPWRAALCLLGLFLGLAPAFAAGAPAPGGAPLPPVPKSPVEYFRELLAMTPAERRTNLATRTPESQKMVLAKVREYESLKPDQRELRLRVTELRWHLLPLLQTPATNRAHQLELLAPDDRKLVEDRLREWDKMPPETQQELLDNEAAIRYFSELEADTEEHRRRILESMSPARRAKLEAGIAQWRALPLAHQRKISSRFNQFFDLTPQEKDKALSTLSEPERRQIEKTLRAYSALPPEQRAQCLRSFQKFTSLPLAERQQFLKNAERWKLMSPAERQSWRELVKSLSDLPPLPSDLPPMPR